MVLLLHLLRKIQPDSLIQGAGGQEYGKVVRGECQACTGTEFEPQHYMASQEMLGAVLSITGMALVVPTLWGMSSTTGPESRTIWAI